MFEGMGLVNDLLPYARKRNHPPLTEAMSAQSRALTERQSETAQLVVDLEALQRRLGIAVAPRPSSPAEFRAWRDAVAADARNRLATDGPGSAAFEAGEIFAAAISNLAVANLVHYFLAAAQPQPLLRARLTGLAGMHARLRDRWAALASSTALPAAARPLAQRVLELLDAAPALDGADSAAAIPALQATVTALYGQRAGLEDGWRAAP